MFRPGEVNQAIGQAYQAVFIGALEASIKPFENKFTVQREPEKTSFSGRNGKAYSFDFCGVYNHPLGSNEVFGESKGYSNGGNLLSEFRTFIAKAYVTSVDYQRHAHDHFWFVTNVPFACSEGSGLRTFEFVKKALIDSKNAEVQGILAEGHVDDQVLRDLVSRLGIFILTDSYLMKSEISYEVEAGETLWSILKKFHAGRAPSNFGDVSRRISNKNSLASPNKIRTGQRIKLQWMGFRWDTEAGRF